jgi:hypothetical protein
MLSNFAFSLKKPKADGRSKCSEPCCHQSSVLFASMRSPSTSSQTPDGAFQINGKNPIPETPGKDKMIFRPMEYITTITVPESAKIF